MSQSKQITSGMRTKNIAGHVLSTLIMSASVPLAFAAPTHRNFVEAVDVAQQGQDTVIKFRMHEKLSSIPDNFSMVGQSKIVVDFVGSSSRVATVSELSGGFVEGLSLSQDAKKTRAVLRVVSNPRYSARIEGNDVVLTLRANENTKPSAASTSGVAAAAVSGLDFKRGPDGEARVLIDLTSEIASVDVKRQGQSLIIDLPGVSLPDALKKKYNVNDFGTLVQSFSALRAAGTSRIVVDAKGEWQYDSYQADRHVVVKLSQRKQDGKVTEGKIYTGEKMPIVNFQNVEVRSLLSVLADFTKLNFIASDSVQGNITLQLRNVPWDQVLDIVLEARNLGMKRSGNVILVAPREELAKREKEVLDNAAAISDTEPLKTESFQLNYTTGDELVAILTNDKQKILSKRGSAVVDPRTNQVFVQDIPERLAEVAKMVKKIDIAMRQVQIEARIVEAGDKFSRSLGARLGFNQSAAAPYAIGGKNAVIGGGLPATGYATGQVTDMPSLIKDGLSVNLPASSSSGAAPGVFSMVLFNNSLTKFLNLELSALEADGKGKIISSPRVVTHDQEVALIEQGIELPYQEASASGASTVSFKKANLRLEVKPHITPDGNIIMSVEINKDAPGAATASGIAIDTKHIKAKVMIENGGTVVIGGIFTQDERTDVSKIPLLGDIPVAGALFRNKVKQDSKTELLFFLTPRILPDSRISAGK